MDSEHPKKHSAETWGLLFTIAVTAGGALVSYGIQKERIDNLTDQVAELRREHEEMRRDKTMADKLEEVRIGLVRVQEQVSDVSSDVKELKETKKR